MHTTYIAYIHTRDSTTAFYTFFVFVCTRAFAPTRKGGSLRINITRTNTCHRFINRIYIYGSCTRNIFLVMYITRRITNLRILIYHHCIRPCYIAMYCYFEMCTVQHTYAEGKGVEDYLS
jgi:hypothetical protein